MKIKAMNHRFILGFLFLLETNALAKMSNKLTYSELPNLIKNNNGSVKSARLMVEASNKRTGHLMRSYLPKIKTYLGYENYITSTFSRESEPYGSIEASMNVFNFGKDSLEEDVRKANHKKYRMAKKLDFNSKLYEARRVFWKIVFHNELIGILENADKQNRKILASAKRRIKRGLTTKTDQLEFKMYGKELRSNIESLKRENKILMIALSQYLGTNVRTRKINIKSIPHDHNKELVSEKFNAQGNATVKYAEAKSQILKSKASISSLWWTPSIDIYGGYSLYTLRDRTFTSRSNRDDTFVGIRLTMNIFDGLRSSNEASAERIKSSAAKSRLKYIVDEIASQHELIQEEMRHVHKLTHVSEDKIKQGSVYFKRTLKEYDKGIKNSLDVLNSLQRIVSFKSEHASIRLDYQNKKASLLKIRGM